MKKIEHYMLPENANGLYKKEAASSIALAKEVAEKINEIIDLVNGIEPKLLAKEQEQDGRIRKAVLFMKDNLVNSLNDILSVYRDSGFIDERIQYHARLLTDRLDNLLSMVPVGSTTMDAELIDLRTDTEGKAYANAGSAVRTQFQFAMRSPLGNGYVTSGNLSTVLPNADNAKANTFYTLNFGAGADLPQNMPWEKNVSNNALMFLVTFGAGDYFAQIIIGYTGAMYQRYKAGNWSEWKQIRAIDEAGVVKIGERSVVHVGSGLDYEKLTDALRYANNTGNVDVYVHSGTYDILEELGEEFINSFPAGYSTISSMNIGNNNHYYFAPGSKVLCNYTGNNANFKAYFSPFNSLAESHGSFIVDGLNLECSGVRYAIHDDISGLASYENHIYKNCEIKADRRAIGAGFGSNMFVEIADCVFRSIGSGAMVSWHNSEHEGTNKMNIHGCYFEGEGNTLRLLHYGNYEKKSLVCAYGNKFAAEPVIEKEGSAAYENITLEAWNNTIG